MDRLMTYSQHLLTHQAGDTNEMVPISKMEVVEMLKKMTMLKCVVDVAIT